MRLKYILGDQRVVTRRNMGRAANESTVNCENLNGDARRWDHALGNITPGTVSTNCILYTLMMFHY